MNRRRKAMHLTATAATVYVMGGILIGVLYDMGAAALAMFLVTVVVTMLAVAEHHADTADRDDLVAQANDAIRAAYRADA